MKNKHIIKYQIDMVFSFLKKKRKYNLSVLPREFIDNSIPLLGEREDKKKWILIFKFHNGLNVTYACDSKKIQFKKIVGSFLKHFDCVREKSSPSELKDYYLSEYKRRVCIESCMVEFEYYHLNVNKINDILKMYVK